MSLTSPARLLITAALVAGAALCRAQSPDIPAYRLLALLNADRAARHLAPLRWSNALATAALDHAEQATRHPTLEHQYPGEPDLLRRAALAEAHVSSVAENLFRGSVPALAVIEQTWLSTPVHRANLLNPQLDSAGIALLQLPSGGLIAVEDLGRSAPAMDLPETDRTLLRSLNQHGLPDVHITEAAIALCLQYNSSPIASPPATVVQWDGPDPTALPSALLALLARQTFRQAELGSCPGQASAQGFSTTRVTLLLR